MISLLTLRLWFNTVFLIIVCWEKAAGGAYWKCRLPLSSLQGWFCSYGGSQGLLFISKHEKYFIPWHRWTVESLGEKKTSTQSQSTPRDSDFIGLGCCLSIWIFRSFWLLLIVQTRLRITEFEETTQLSETGVKAMYTIPIKKFNMLLFIYFISAALGLCCGMQARLPCGMWDLTSLTRCRTCVPCIGRQILKTLNVFLYTFVSFESLTICWDGKSRPLSFTDKQTET